MSKPNKSVLNILETIRYLKDYEEEIKAAGERIPAVMAGDELTADQEILIAEKLWDLVKLVEPHRVERVKAHYRKSVRWSLASECIGLLVGLGVCAFMARK